MRLQANELAPELHDATPSASETKILPAPWLPSTIFKVVPDVPFISSFVDGAPVVLIPTLSLKYPLPTKYAAKVLFASTL